jgi:hypothetical protein
MLSATCLDPDGDGWGSVDYEGEWTVCDQSGDGTYPWVTPVLATTTLPPNATTTLWIW